MSYSSPSGGAFLRPLRLKKFEVSIVTRKRRKLSLSRDNVISSIVNDIKLLATLIIRVSEKRNCERPGGGGGRGTFEAPRKYARCRGNGRSVPGERAINLLRLAMKAPDETAEIFMDG